MASANQSMIQRKMSAGEAIMMLTMCDKIRRLLDQDRDRELSVAELRLMVEATALDYDIDLMLDELDPDRRGRIGTKQLLKWFMDHRLSVAHLTKIHQDLKARFQQRAREQGTQETDDKSAAEEDILVEFGASTWKRMGSQVNARLKASLPLRNAMESLLAVVRESKVDSLELDEAKTKHKTITVSNAPFGLIWDCTRVVSVTKGSPAEKAGVKAGSVLLSIDGKQVPRDAPFVRWAKRASKTPYTITLAQPDESALMRESGPSATRTRRHSVRLLERSSRLQNLNNFQDKLVNDLALLARETPPCGTYLVGEDTPMSVLERKGSSDYFRRAGPTVRRGEYLHVVRVRQDGKQAWGYVYRPAPGWVPIGLDLQGATVEYAGVGRSPCITDLSGPALDVYIWFHRMGQVARSFASEAGRRSLSPAWATLVVPLMEGLSHSSFALDKLPTLAVALLPDLCSLLTHLLGLVDRLAPPGAQTDSAARTDLHLACNRLVALIASCVSGLLVLQPLTQLERTEPVRWWLRSGLLEGGASVLDKGGVGSGSLLPTIEAKAGLVESLLNWADRFEDTGGSEENDSRDRDLTRFIRQVAENKGLGAPIVKAVSRVNKFKRIRRSDGGKPAELAVCATFAALLKHTGLARDALALATETSKLPRSAKKLTKKSPLVLLWGKAHLVTGITRRLRQEIRDEKDAKGQQAFEAGCAQIVRNAMFLVRVRPSPRGAASNTAAIHTLDSETMMQAYSEMLPPDQVSTLWSLDDDEGMPSSQEEKLHTQDHQEETHPHSRSTSAPMTASLSSLEQKSAPRQASIPFTAKGKATPRSQRRRKLQRERSREQRLSVSPPPKTKDSSQRPPVKPAGTIGILTRMASSEALEAGAERLEAGESPGRSFGTLMTIADHVYRLVSGINTNQSDSAESVDMLTAVRLQRCLLLQRTRAMARLLGLHAANRLVQALVSNRERLNMLLHILPQLSVMFTPPPRVSPEMSNWLDKLGSDNTGRRYGTAVEVLCSQLGVGLTSANVTPMDRALLRSSMGFLAGTRVARSLPLLPNEEWKNRTDDEADGRREVDDLSEPPHHFLDGLGCIGPRLAQEMSTRFFATGALVLDAVHQATALSLVQRDRFLGHALELCALRFRASDLPHLSVTMILDDVLELLPLRQLSSTNAAPSGSEYVPRNSFLVQNRAWAYFSSLFRFTFGGCSLKTSEQKSTSARTGDALSDNVGPNSSSVLFRTNIAQFQDRILERTLEQVRVLVSAAGFVRLKDATTGKEAKEAIKGLVGRDSFVWSVVASKASLSSNWLPGWHGVLGPGTIVRVQGLQVSQFSHINGKLGLVVGGLNDLDRLPVLGEFGKTPRELITRKFRVAHLRVVRHSAQERLVFSAKDNESVPKDGKAADGKAADGKAAADFKELTSSGQYELGTSVELTQLKRTDYLNGRIGLIMGAAEDGRLPVWGFFGRAGELRCCSVRPQNLKTLVHTNCIDPVQIQVVLCQLLYLIQDCMRASPRLVRALCATKWQQGILARLLREPTGQSLSKHRGHILQLTQGLALEMLQATLRLEPPVPISLTPPTDKEDSIGTTSASGSLALVLTDTVARIGQFEIPIPLVDKDKGSKSPWEKRVDRDVRSGIRGLQSVVDSAVCLIRSLFAPVRVWVLLHAGEDTSSVVLDKTSLYVQSGHTVAQVKLLIETTLSVPAMEQRLLLVEASGGLRALQDQSQYMSQCGLYANAVLHIVHQDPTLGSRAPKPIRVVTLDESVPMDQLGDAKVLPPSSPVTVLPISAVKTVVSTDAKNESYTSTELGVKDESKGEIEKSGRLPVVVGGKPRTQCSPEVQTWMESIPVVDRSQLRMYLDKRPEPQARLPTLEFLVKLREGKEDGHTSLKIHKSKLWATRIIRHLASLPEEEWIDDGDLDIEEFDVKSVGSRTWSLSIESSVLWRISSVKSILIRLSEHKRSSALSSGALSGLKSLERDLVSAYAALAVLGGCTFSVQEGAQAIAVHDAEEHQGTVLRLFQNHARIRFSEEIGTLTLLRSNVRALPRVGMDHSRLTQPERYLRTIRQILRYSEGKAAAALGDGVHDKARLNALSLRRRVVQVLYQMLKSPKIVQVFIEQRFVHFLVKLERPHGWRTIADLEYQLTVLDSIPIPARDYDPDTKESGTGRTATLLEVHADIYTCHVCTLQQDQKLTVCKGCGAAVLSPNIAACQACTFHNKLPLPGSQAASKPIECKICGSKLELRPSNRAYLKLDAKSRERPPEPKDARQARIQSVRVSLKALGSTTLGRGKGQQGLEEEEDPAMAGMDPRNLSAKDTKVLASLGMQPDVVQLSMRVENNSAVRTVGNLLRQTPDFRAPLVDGMETVIMKVSSAESRAPRRNPAFRVLAKPGDRIAVESDDVSIAHDRKATGSRAVDPTESKFAHLYPSQRAIDTIETLRKLGLEGKLTRADYVTARAAAETDLTALYARSCVQALLENLPMDNPELVARLATDGGVLSRMLMSYFASLGTGTHDRSFDGALADPMARVVLGVLRIELGRLALACVTQPERKLSGSVFASECPASFQILQLLVDRLVCVVRSIHHQKSTSRKTTLVPKRPMAAVYWIVDLFLAVARVAMRKIDNLVILERVLTCYFPKCVAGLITDAVLSAQGSTRFTFTRLLSTINNKLQGSLPFTFPRARFEAIHKLMFEMHASQSKQASAKCFSPFLMALIDLNVTALRMMREREERKFVDERAWFGRVVSMSKVLMALNAKQGGDLTDFVLHDVISHLSDESRRNNAYDSLEKWLCSKFNQECDEAIVEFVNQCHIKHGSFDPARDFKSSNLYEQFPVLRAKRIEMDEVRNRYEILLRFNQHFCSSLAYVNLSLESGASSITDETRSARGFVFWSSKAKLWDEGLKATEQKRADQDRLLISNFRAARVRDSGVDFLAKETIFGQVYQAWKSKPAVFFRAKPNQRICIVVEKGQFSHDAGGPYRNLFASIVHELEAHQRVLPLFVACPNARHHVGKNRDAFLPMPIPSRASAATRALRLRLFEFVGKLMGLAIRTRLYLDFHLAATLWKRLVSDRVDPEDVEAVDSRAFAAVRAVDKLMAGGKEGKRDAKLIDADVSEALRGVRMATHDANGHPIELVPGGNRVPIHQGNYQRYAELLVAFKCREGRDQANAIQRGLACVVPYQIVSIFSWNELQDQVCGRVAVDIDLLKANTEYPNSDVKAHHKHVKMLWDLLENRFDNKQRSQFLFFVWGRSRLPTSSAGFTQKFQIMKHHRSAARRARVDDYFPIAHTCFFQLELPAYTNPQAMYKKISWAIANCTTIDGDDTSEARRAMRMRG